MTDGEMAYLALISINSNQKGYRVSFPDLPGCIAGGDTLSEAIMGAERALSTHILSLPDTPNPSSFEVVSKMPQSNGVFIYNCSITFRNLR